MNYLKELKPYIIKLDNDYTTMIDKSVAEKGIIEYLNQQLIYLDCSRILQGMRMMQTIGFPYQKEISSYIYAVTKEGNGQEDTDFIKNWIDKLIERHNANLEYEKENPPVWYDGKPKKASRRKSKAKEGDMFPKETKKPKISRAEAKLKAKLLGANLGFGSFKFKKD